MREPSPFRVFDRPDDNHYYKEALLDWLKNSDPDMRDTYRAIALNIIFDGRVQIEREIAFDRCTRKPRTANELERAVVDYFKERVQTKKRPDFTNTRLNNSNIIDSPNAIQPSGYLARVLDISRLTPVFERYQYDEPWIEWFQGCQPASVIEFSRILDDFLGTPGQRRDEFIKAVFEMLNRDRQSHPFQPSWVVLWDAFVSAIPDYVNNPNRWLECTGQAISRKSLFTWLILLRYTTEKAIKLVRPTQLDAGWNQYHFPSPRGLRKEEGGFAMDMRYPPDKSNVAMTEFIHPQIDLELDFWRDAGSLCAKINIFRETREHHRELLHQRYPFDPNWMNPVI